MKNTIKALFLATILIATVSCDNNDDAQTTPSTPTDGFTIGNTFHATPNAYVAIDQLDLNNNGNIDYYTFLFTDGRITDTYGDAAVGYAHAFSTNTTKLVKLQAFESANPNMSNGLVGTTLVASSINSYSMGFTNYGFSKDSFIAYDLQQGSTIFGNENGFDFTQIPEVVGIWHYAGTVGPTITINAINIDYTTPANSTANVDYTFMDSSGVLITGHYEGTLGIILD